MRSGWANFAQATDSSPMVPGPTTATVSSGCTLARSVPCTTQAKGSARAAASNGNVAEKAWARSARATAYSAKPPGSVNPCSLYERHRLVSPRAHHAQVRQKLWPSTATRWPMARLLTAGPTSSTVPHHSWPGMTGYLT
jgi:hypothetical protein